MKKQINITKKQIARVLNSLNRTDIYRLVAQIKGSTPSAADVYDFIDSNAKSNRVLLAAYRIAYNGASEKRSRFGYLFNQDQVWKSRCFYRTNKIMEIVLFAKAMVEIPECNYTKVPILSSKDEIVFVSKKYGMSDYNRWHTGFFCEKENDFVFANTLLKYVKKHINY